MNAEMPSPTSYWPEHVLSDFPRVLVRITTLTRKRAHHLLFGCVELFPPEVPGPDSLSAERESIGADQFVTSAAVLPVGAALAWYEAALTGNLTVPGIPGAVPVQTVPLAAEPGLGHFVAAAKPPVSAPWHGGTRLHRLVPMEEQPEVIRELKAGIIHPDRTKKARRWLKERLHFDVLDADESLGGLVLLVPNPVLRSLSSFPLETSATVGEVIRVQATARDRHGYETLEVTLREERPDGTFLIGRSRLDVLGRADFVLPHQVEQTGLELRCDVRGLLAVQPCAGFIRGISLEMRSSRTQLAVTVPGRRKAAPTTHYTTCVMETLSESHVGPPPSRGVANRLAALLDRSAGRTSAVAARERVFHEDRAGAVEFLRALVQGGSEHVIFVDPFFGAEDILEFALAVMPTGCRVGVLRSRQEGLWSSNVNSPEGEKARHPGAALFACIENVNRARQRQLPIDVRLMGGEARVYHDRFLLVDRTVWHLGHSLNQIGGSEVSVVTRLADTSPLLAWIPEDIKRAEPFASAWPAMLAGKQAQAAQPYLDLTAAGSNPK
jgi:hypothetical protein